LEEHYFISLEEALAREPATNAFSLLRRIATTTTSSPATSVDSPKSCFPNRAGQEASMTQATHLKV